MESHFLGKHEAGVFLVTAFRTCKCCYERLLSNTVEVVFHGTFVSHKANTADTFGFHPVAPP